MTVRKEARRAAESHDERQLGRACRGVQLALLLRPLGLDVEYGKPLLDGTNIRMVGNLRPR